MSRHATIIHLTPDERAELERRIRARTSPQQAVLRAQIILRAAAGTRNQAIAAALGVVRHTVQRWRDRFAAERLPGLDDRPHQPAPRRYGPERQAQIVLLACPPWGGQARRTGPSWTWPSISASIPNSTWAGPARARSARSSRRPTSAWTGFDSWMDERDPDFVAKAVAIIELELQPPTDGPTFCVDEKTGIGVREPAAPSQPVAPGQPARREFEYVRHGTADLLAAFCVQTGQVSGIVRPRHRASEFIELLRLLDSRVPRGQIIHLILDPVRMHCSAEVAVYVYYHPDRFRFHWLPKHASWLSFIEVWFAILSKKCLKRSAWAHFAAAEQTIMEFIATYNTHQAHPFTWRKGIRFYQRLKDKLAEAAAGAAEVA